MRMIIFVSLILLSLVVASATSSAMQNGCGDIYVDPHTPSTGSNDHQDLNAIPGVEETCHRAPVYSYHDWPYAYISIGTPARKFMLVLDTMVGEIILPTRTMTSGRGVLPHIFPSYLFNASKSSTFQNDSSSWTGNVSSYDFGWDNFSVADIKLRQRFSLGFNRCNGPAGYIVGSGCLGLNVRSLVGKTFLQNAFNEKKLGRPLFSPILPKHKLVGEILFGGIDHRYADSLAFSKVTAISHWYFPIFNVTFNSHPLANTTGALVDILAWTTSFPNAAAEDLHHQTDGASEKIRTSDDRAWKWTVPCSLKTSTDKLAFRMGGKTISISLGSLVVERGTEPFTWCETNIRGVDAKYATLGRIFLENFYMVFDQGPTTQFGLAPLQVPALAP
ncbi:unnamed protein product [Mortierella alpina]